jgi:hypothetical protein
VGHHSKKKVFSLAKLAEVVKNRGVKIKTLKNLSRDIFFGGGFNFPG